MENKKAAQECKSPYIADITEAAECALHLALVNEAFIDNTNIPLIAHQTSRSAEPETWSSLVRDCIETWLLAATGQYHGFGRAEMAWMIWDDAGVDALVQKYEPGMYQAFSALPYPVEKADAFRVLVLKWFGGVVSGYCIKVSCAFKSLTSQQYADIDSKPLTHPSTWVKASDLDDWLDEKGNKHAHHQPEILMHNISDNIPASYTSRTGISNAETLVTKSAVNAIFGIEADNLPEPDDTYWRMGYTFPVQITNWALAMAPHHPVADRFLSNLTERIRADGDALSRIDPLDLTGPPALTRTVKDYSESTESNFSWQSLSSINDSAPGGHAKIVAGDVLVLPITGFSPGRGRFRNMGSQPTSHPSARLVHMAAGSWRKADLHVTYGKLCRTVFGLCRDWSKIPDP